MKEYPTGVMQNLSVANIGQPHLVPVGEQNWRMFATLQDAQTGFEMIQSVAPDAWMQDETEGQYVQFWYNLPNPDIRVRGVYGTVYQDGVTLKIQEFPSDIFDRYSHPTPFVDRYNSGEPHFLRCAQIAEGLGQLYWANQ